MVSFGMAVARATRGTSDTDSSVVAPVAAETAGHARPARAVFLRRNILRAFPADAGVNLLRVTP